MSELYRRSEEVAESEFEEVSLPRPPGSIPDIQYLYGSLYLLGRESGPDDVATEYQAHLTPDRNDDLLDQPETLVFIDLRILPDEQQLAYLGVTVRAYDEDMKPRLAHSRYDVLGTIDHSITHRSGENPPEKTGWQASRLFQKWPTEDGVADVAESHPQGWLIAELEALGSDEKAMERLEADVEAELSDTRRRIVSVRFTTASADEYETPEGLPDDVYEYPADREVLLEAMAQRRIDKWATKNQGDSRGEGAGYVRGEETEIYGTTPAPLGLYTTKKQAWLPRFDGDEGAYTHPISERVAPIIDQSQEFMDVCYRGVAGGRLYNFPYFAGEQTPEKLRTLYALLWAGLEEAHTSEEPDERDQGPITPIERFYRRFEDLPQVSETLVEDLRFHTVFLTYAGTAVRVRAMAEASATAAVHHIDAADAAATVAEELGSGSSTAGPEVSFWDTETNFLAFATSPRYFLATCPRPPVDEDDLNTNTPAFQFYRAFMLGDDIQLSRLFRAYVERADAEYDPDEGAFPTWLLRQQYAQLATLDRLDQLETDNTTSGTDRADHSTKFEPMNDSTTELWRGRIETTATSYAEAEAETYRNFIESHPLLANRYSRRAAFTLGVLAATIAQYQRKEGKNPLTDRYGPKTVTKQNFKQRTTELLNFVNEYAAENDQVMRYHTMVGQLSDDLSHEDPSDWDLSTEDVQFHFALGLSYGAQHREYDLAEDGANDANEAES